MPRFSFLAPVLAVVACAATLVTPSVATAGAPDSGAYVVRFVEGVDVDAEVRSVRAQGVQVDRSFKLAIKGFSARMNPAQAAALENNPRIAAVEADSVVTVSATQTPVTWGLDRIDQNTRPLSNSFTYTPATTAVDVYVIDTGIYGSHDEFSGRVKSGYSAIADGNGTVDCNGHGTHVSGTIAGTTYGIAKSAALIPVRVLDCSGSGTTSGVIAGVEWAMGNHLAGVPAVANMSLGGGANSSLDTAVANLVADGVSVVVAAGNSSADACTSSPARVGSAITVAASDINDTQAYFSNFGSCVDLYAPGVSITSSWIGSVAATNTISGTSMASPHVAGVAALILGGGSALTPNQMAAKITADAGAGLVTGASANTANRLLFLNQSVTAPPVPSAVAPSAPTSVVATALSKAASLTWVQGSNGGSALTSQIVKVYTSGRLFATASISGSATSVTISGLKPQTSYTFTVSAVNAFGTSPASAASAPITTKR